MMIQCRLGDIEPTKCLVRVVGKFEGELCGSFWICAQLSRSVGIMTLPGMVKRTAA
jgi:hypothetical protein